MDDKSIQVSSRKGLTFRQFAKIHVERAEEWHDEHPWSPADWTVATLGEFGEAANIIKKLKRDEDNIRGNAETVMQLHEDLAIELADTLTYLFLLADSLGIDLEAATVAKFNKVSKKHDLPQYIKYV